MRPFCYLSFLMFASLAGAGRITVTLDTSQLVGNAAGPFALGFELADGSRTPDPYGNVINDGNNAVAVSKFQFGTGGPAGPPNNFGSSSGDLSSSVLLSDLEGNGFSQVFNPGSTLSFEVSFTSNQDAGIADEFVVVILDKNGQPIPTTGGIALLQIDFDSANPTVQEFAGDPTQFLSTGGAGIPVAAPSISVLSAQPALFITSAHTGTFVQGQGSATYTLTVSNAPGAGLSSGMVTVTETVPAGLTLLSMSGTGWSCSANTCTRSDALASGASYPVILATVSVSSNAAASVSNAVSVSGGGSSGASANDATTISPATANTPKVVSANPQVSSGAGQTFQFQFSDDGGYQALGVVNVLINNYLDGRQACYLAYSLPVNALYIVADNGDATQLSGKVMDGTGVVANSQCSVNLASSTVVQSGNVLTLNLAITFSSGFAGNKVVYMAARDTGTGNSGWQTKGVHGVLPPVSTFPNPIGMSPSSGNTGNPTLTLTFQDATNALNLQTGWALINTAIDGRGACYVAYYRPGNQIYLYPDNGDGTQATSTVLAGTNSLTNSQCTISAQGSNVTVNGSQLVVTLNVSFKAGFTGPKGVWMAAQTVGGVQTSAWQALGAWDVP